jgi:hypothetical protein
VIPPSAPLFGGIHWHMNIANKIEYYASDEKRQIISWVRLLNTPNEFLTTTVLVVSPPWAKAKFISSCCRRAECRPYPILPKQPHARPIFGSTSGAKAQIVSGADKAGLQAGATQKQLSKSIRPVYQRCTNYFSLDSSSG